MFVEVGCGGHHPVTIERVLIMGAAGRDFHTFNTYFRNHPGYEVVAFTAAQIPGIADRRYPPALSGAYYPHGIPIYPEEQLETLIAREHIHQVLFAYSDVSHLAVMHLASRVRLWCRFSVARASAQYARALTSSDFRVRGSHRVRQRHGRATTCHSRATIWAAPRGGTPPDALWGFSATGRAALRHGGRL